MISFLTPYWTGREMMKIHLRSIRQFYPTAPILVSARNPDIDEMEAHKNAFGVTCWSEDCKYDYALTRLIKRCDTEYACVLDHDVVLLSSLDPLLGGLVDGRWDLVGVEERIRDPYVDSWFRFAPGYTDATLMIFNAREFVRRWGLSGVRWNKPSGSRNQEYHYGICQRLTRHKYLRPYHTRKYGFGNLLMDGEALIAWHQWYGAYRKRSLAALCPDGAESLAKAEQAFLADYPALDLSELRPAWAPEVDITGCAPARPPATLRSKISGALPHGVLCLIDRCRGAY